MLLESKFGKNTGISNLFALVKKEYFCDIYYQDNKMTYTSPSVSVAIATPANGKNIIKDNMYFK